VPSPPHISIAATVAAAPDLHEENLFAARVQHWLSSSNLESRQKKIKKEKDSLRKEGDRRDSSIRLLDAGR